MNLEEVEEALQQINNHLLTDKEFFFLYNVSIGALSFRESTETLLFLRNKKFKTSTLRGRNDNQPF